MSVDQVAAAWVFPKGGSAAWLSATIDVAALVDAGEGIQSRIWNDALAEATHEGVFDGPLALASVEAALTTIAQQGGGHLLHEGERIALRASFAAEHEAEFGSMLVLVAAAAAAAQHGARGTLYLLGCLLPHRDDGFDYALTIEPGSVEERTLSHEDATSVRDQLDEGEADEFTLDEVCEPAWAPPLGLVPASPDVETRLLELAEMPEAAVPTSVPTAGLRRGPIRMVSEDVLVALEPDRVVLCRLEDGAWIERAALSIPGAHDLALGHGGRAAVIVDCWGCASVIGLGRDRVELLHPPHAVLAGVEARGALDDRLYVMMPGRDRSGEITGIEEAYAAVFDLATGSLR